MVTSTLAERLAPPKTLLGLSTEDVSRARETSVLGLFRAAAVRVPAYRDFLLKHGVAAERIRTLADFAAVPPVSKQNYLTQYSMAEMCWDGRLDDKRVIFTSSSGSTGQPFYFPRDGELDYRSSLIFELALVSMSRGRLPPTLFIVSFGMGVWIGGVISLQSLRLMGERGHQVSVITPGSNKKEVFEALKRLAPKYEQVVLGGYPPFVKDILDTALENGFDTTERPLKVFCAAEGFSETFRDYVVRKSGASDPLFDVTNLYGTADIGTMAIETPISIALRRRALEDSALYTKLFSNASKLPTLAQYHPAVTNFEEVEGRLLVTGDNVLPLIRYDIGDHGGVRGYDEVMAAAETSRPGLVESVYQAGAPRTALPFVYVYERADFSVKLCGAIIYAEHVRAALQENEIESDVTGKFSMSVKHDQNEDEYLELHVELKSRRVVSEELVGRVCQLVMTVLRDKNAEYRYLSDNIKDKVVPKIVLWPHEDPTHFRPGAKQQWVSKI